MIPCGCKRVLYIYITKHMKINVGCIKLILLKELLIFYYTFPEKSEKPIKFINRQKKNTWITFIFHLLILVVQLFLILQKDFLETYYYY